VGVTGAAELPGPVVTFQCWRVTNLDRPFPEMVLHVSTRTLSNAQSFHAKRGRLYSDVEVVAVIAGELRDGDPAHVKLMPQEDGSIAVSSKRLGWYRVVVRFDKLDAKLVGERGPQA
jgi:hypothetical protein